MTTAADNADPLVGRVLEDRYTVVAPLGEGAMSQVYRAEQPDGPPVAVKVLQQETGGDPELRERFEREARALFGLQHPNILEVHDFGIVDGSPYLVMEMLDGTTLDTMFEDAPPDPETAVDLARQVLAGLAYAHAQGVLHRDLKTENVFVARDAQGRLVAKLLDFGLVKFVDENRWGEADKLTTFGTVFGTPAYMSPEQVTGTPADARTDVYAAGVILFELMTGIWPFMEEDRAEMFRAHLMTPPPTLGETRPEMSFRSELEKVVRKALAKAPHERFSDAREMLTALDALPRPVARPRTAQDERAGQQGNGTSAVMWFGVGIGIVAALAVLIVGAVAVLWWLT